MNSWGARKQIIIGGIAGGVLFLCFVVFIYFKFLNKPPTCFDNILNQNERGVDCGGVCTKVCEFDSKDPIVYFERFFEAGPGVYNVLSLIENPNKESFARSAQYIFKLYGQDGVLLSERVGEVVIPPGRIIPIFEHSMNTGEREPVSVSFVFSQFIDWRTGNYAEPSLKVVTEGIQSSSTTPILEAEVLNDEVREVKDTKAIALIYDKEGNVMASSQTIVSSVPAQGRVSIFFTWNKPFVRDFGKSEIVLRPEPIFR